MVQLPGGVVVVGPYVADPAHLGSREVWLGPYAIDREARPGVTRSTCRVRKARLATEAELEHALRDGAVTRGAGAELTATIATPADAEALANVEGAGFYEVLLDGPMRLVLRFPGEQSEAAVLGRCVTGPEAPRRARKLKAAVALDRGRGATWTQAESFFALGDRPPAPRKLAKGETVYVVHEEGGFAFVALLPEGEPQGWVRSDAVK